MNGRIWPGSMFTTVAPNEALMSTRTLTHTHPHTLTLTQLMLAAGFILATSVAGCDEPIDDEDGVFAEDENGDDAGAIESRTCPSGCSSNTNLVFGTPLIHHDEGTFPTAAIQEENGWYHKFTGASCPVWVPSGMFGYWTQAAQTSWEVMLSGEIRFYRITGGEFPTTITTGGTSVNGCYFTLNVSNNVGFLNSGSNIAKTDTLSIIDVSTTPINNKNTGTNPGSRYKYLMGVTDILKAPNAPMLSCIYIPDSGGQCEPGTEVWSTCVPDSASDGDMWMGARYGLKVEANNTWSTIYGVSQFLCHESVHGKFAKWGVPNSTFYTHPERASAISAAIGLYYKGDYTTNLGNQAFIRTNSVWPGFDQHTTVPTGYAKEGMVQVTNVGTGKYTAEYACRGNSTSSWYSVNRNSGTSVDPKYKLDWDLVDPNGGMFSCDPYISSNAPWDVISFAKCQVSGTSPNIVQSCISNY